MDKNNFCNATTTAKNSLYDPYSKTDQVRQYRYQIPVNLKKKITIMHGHHYVIMHYSVTKQGCLVKTPDSFTMGNWAKPG